MPQWCVWANYLANRIVARSLNTWKSFESDTAQSASSMKNLHVVAAGNRLPLLETLRWSSNADAPHVNNAHRVLQKLFTKETILLNHLSWFLAKSMILNHFRQSCAFDRNWYRCAIRTQLFKQENDLPLRIVLPPFERTTGELYQL